MPNFADQLALSLDPQLTTFQFPQRTGLTPNPSGSMADMFSYSQPDVFSQSYLQNLPQFNLDDNLFEDMPRSSHDDLNQFFNDAAFGGGTPGVGSRLGGGDKALEPVGGSWLRNAQQSPPDWEHQNVPLAVDTSVEKVGEQRETLVKNGQITPGNSPSSPNTQKTVRKASRKTKATSMAETVVASAPAATERNDAAAPAPVKRVRKPRRSTKKKPTPEQEAAKRETFLKRNREAAYKCRIKKKTQTEMIVERAKALDQDNAVKGLEVERLKREIEGLRALLLPHWRTCADDNVNSYVDNLVNGGWGLGKMVLGTMIPRPEFDAGEEPTMEDDSGSDPGSNHGCTHPRDGDENGEMEGPAHKRRRSEAVFEMSSVAFDHSMATMDASRQRRESFFANSLGPEEVLKDALGCGGSISSSGTATPAVRATMGRLEMLNEDFLIGDTPPPLDLSAPDGT